MFREGGVEVQVLGAAGCHVGTRSISFSARQRGVLAALATGAGRPVSYDVLYDLVWETPPSSARAVVHNSVGAMRRAVGVPFIESSPDGYRLADGVSVDIDEFLRAANHQLAIAPAAADPDDGLGVLGLLRGRPFDDLVDADVIEARRLQVAEVAAGVEDHVAASLLSAGRIDEALGRLRAGLVEDPFRQRRVALTMLALHRRGQSREALALAHQVRSQQVVQAGLDAPALVASLERRILDEDRRLHADEAIASIVSTREEPGPAATEFVGRVDLLHTVRARLDDGASVVLRGAAGVGKSALLHEVAAARQEQVVVTIRCAAVASSPIEPILDVVAQLCRSYPQVVQRATRSVDVAALVRMAPCVEPLAPAFASASALDLTRGRTDAALLGFVGAAADASPMVLVVDDLHVAPAAAQRLLMEAITHPRVAVVAAARPVAGALFDAPTPFEVVDVGGLAPDAVDALVAGVVGEAEVARVATVARRLSAITGDNAFFLVSLTRHLDHLGVLRLMGGEWVVVGEITVPPDVDRFVAELLTGLTPDGRRAVEAACIARTPMAIDQLAEVVGLSKRDLGAAVAEGEDRGLLRRQGRTIELRHDIVGRSVVAAMPGASSMDLHVAWAEVLEALDDPPLARIARHRFESRSLDLAAAVRSSVAAAEQAQASFAHDFAVEHLRRARQLVDDDAAASLDLDIALGRELRDSQDPTHVEVLIGVARRARDRDDPGVAARALTELGDVGALAGAGDADPEARVLVEWVLDTLGGGAARARLEAAVSAWFTFGDDWERGLALWDGACRTAGELGDPRLLADVYKLVDPVTAGPERLDVRDRVAHELLALGDQLDDPTVSYRGHLAMFAVAAQLADRSALDVHVAAMDEFDTRYFHGSRRRVLTYFQAGMAHLAGDLHEADRLLVSASSIPATLSPSWDVLAQASVMLPVRLEQDRLGELHAVVEGLAHDQPTVGAWRAVLAGASVAVGDESTARHQIEQLVASQFSSLARDASWLAALSLTIEAAVDLGLVDLAEQAAAHLRPFAGRALWCGHAVAGLVDTTLGRADALAGREGSARDAFEAASAQADRLRAPIFAGHVWCERQRLDRSASPVTIETRRAEADARGWARLARNLASLAD